MLRAALADPDGNGVPLIGGFRTVCWVGGTPARSWKGGGMRLALQVPSFTWRGGAPALGSTVAKAVDRSGARAAIGVDQALVSLTLVRERTTFEPVGELAAITRVGC